MKSVFEVVSEGNRGRWLHIPEQIVDFNCPLFV